MPSVRPLSGLPSNGLLPLPPRTQAATDDGGNGGTSSSRKSSSSTSAKDPTLTAAGGAAAAASTAAAGKTTGGVTKAEVGTGTELAIHSAEGGEGMHSVRSDALLRAVDYQHGFDDDIAQFAIQYRRAVRIGRRGLAWLGLAWPLLAGHLCRFAVA